MRYIGVYSYPRTGSNWLRFILHGMLTKETADPSFNEERGEYIEKIRREFLGLEDGFHDGGRTYNLANKEEIRCYKTHSRSFVSEYNGIKLDTAYFAYIYRHPLDVFFSYLNFMFLYASDFQQAISLPIRSVEDLIATDTLKWFLGTFLTCGGLDPTFMETSSYWKHVEFWTEAAKRHDNVFAIRYENLMSDPVSELKELMVLTDTNEEQMGHILTNVGRMTAKDGMFFWKQKTEVYKDYLNERQLEEISSLIGDKLEAIGYKI